VVGIIRYDAAPTRLAEIAFVVRDDWQGKGVGTLLMRRATALARAQGLLGFTAQVLVSNAPALALFSEAGLHIQAEREGELFHLEARFSPA
jgi:RimJ/RimL family protein N-acetyltransferase